MLILTLNCGSSSLKCQLYDEASNKIIAKAHNKKEQKQNSLCHAEIIAINKATKKVKNFRLENCEMYVTLEPCIMCAGAILSARLNKVFAELS